MYTLLKLTVYLFEHPDLPKNSKSVSTNGVSLGVGPPIYLTNGRWEECLGNLLGNNLFLCLENPLERQKLHSTLNKLYHSIRKRYL